RDGSSWVGPPMGERRGCISVDGSGDAGIVAESLPSAREAFGREHAYGPQHPEVAIRLNNLAQLLKATNRLADAEPLMPRGLAILGGFGQNTGQEHPRFWAAQENYRIVHRVGKGA